jgi:hypothetical protein
MTDTSRARAIFQNGVCGKCSRQKICQRAMVRPSAPKRVDGAEKELSSGFLH